MTNQTIEQAVEEFKKQFNAYQTTSSSPYPLLVDWLRQALQAQREAGAREVLLSIQKIVAESRTVEEEYGIGNGEATARA